MAYTVTFGHNGKSAQYREYEIDTPDDLDTLPVQAEITAIGSLAHCRSNHVVYRLGNDRTWYGYMVIAKDSDFPSDSPAPIVGTAVVGETTLTE